MIFCLTDARDKVIDLTNGCLRTYQFSAGTICPADINSDPNRHDRL